VLYLRYGIILFREKERPDLKGIETYQARTAATMSSFVKKNAPI